MDESAEVVQGLARERGATTRIGATTAKEGAAHSTMRARSEAVRTARRPAFVRNLSNYFTLEQSRNRKSLIMDMKKLASLLPTGRYNRGTAALFGVCGWALIHEILA